MALSEKELTVIAIWGILGGAVGLGLTPAMSGDEGLPVYFAMVGASIGLMLVLRLRWLRSGR